MVEPRRLGSITTNAVNPVLYKKLPYNHIRDFAPVSMIGTVPNVLVVHPSVKANTVGELITMARAQPGVVTFASSGSGTSIHMSGEMFMAMSGADQHRMGREMLAEVDQDDARAAERETRREIDLQSRLARRALVEHGVELSMTLAKARIEKNITADDQARLVDRYASGVRS